MATQSAIEWTESTWNPVTGCTKISPGCKHCYAERVALRLRAMGQANYVNGFELTLHEHALQLPLKWKKPRTIFVNSMSDLFHQEVPVEFILKVFAVMRQANWHHYQILTKRTGRLLELNPILPWAPHIWMGVSVENEDFTFRINHLRTTSAKVKFLSLEPLLGSLPDLNLSGIDWVIVGGESGPGARFMRSQWARDVRDQCVSARVPFFFKQWGEFLPDDQNDKIGYGLGGTRLGKKYAGRLLNGREWNEMPEIKR